MQPYTEFEAQVKELDKLIDEPINFINEQVAEFERKRVGERKEEIGKIYLESIDGMDDYLPLSSIYDQKWENATTSKKCIKEEIMERVKAVKQEMEVIKGMQTDAVENALAFYKRTLSLADTMHYVNEWEKQKAEILKKQEVEKVREEKPEQNTEPVQISTTSGREELQQEVEKLTGTVTYEIHADPFQIAQIEAAMRKYGIKYRRI